ncbi:hypothetical protein [Pseudaestuariivita rosea]|uniref:hypothetical protein n=1 Tax=Pseudaestuariivita rosea TaxID=2763263 RepID=UPI001ABB203C|nr:hypothetical protein [Pseudaestuariivita rosea]
MISEQKQQEIDRYASSKYEMVAGTLFHVIARAPDRFVLFVDSIANHGGFGSNDADLSLGYEISYHTENYDIDGASYGYALFDLGFDPNYKEHMPLAEFENWLADAYQTLLKYYPNAENDPQLAKDLKEAEVVYQQAIKTVRQLQKDHEKWKRANPGAMV